ncbi:MAG: hypothetical protein FJ146_18625 [Deltaproteobacteria bacterium]|nr:hypothetical protein [Deltaproteobacteria bacterium]
MLQTRGAYVCNQRLQAFAAGNKNPSGLMLPRNLCKRELTPDEIKAILAEGVSPELQGFVSKSGRPFSAKLRLTKEGGVTFEFAERSQGSHEQKRPYSKFQRRRVGKSANRSERPG